MLRWFETNGKESDVVISSRVRLARNVKKYNFSLKLTENDAVKMIDELSEAINSLDIVKDYSSYNFKTLDEYQKQAMKERHVISNFLLGQKQAAGFVSKDEDIYEKSGKDFLSVLETNVVGTFLVTKYALPKMSEKGVIINISSNNSLDNFNPISIDYDASKAGVNMLTKDFAVVTDRKVVAYAPGWISTSEVINMNQDFLRVEMEKVGQEKLIDPEDLVKYIISDVEKRESGEIVEVKNL